ncbi:MAG: LytR C-terminal domain-containing protein [Sphingomicrobium sp.]
MRIATTGLLASTVLVLGACATSDSGIKVRALKSSAAAQPMAVPARIAEGNTQFALGNVALALELYRKASREDVTSTQALVGIARCYQKMGRFDLSRRNYETALAIAPDDTAILGELAGSLRAQGLNSEAEAILAEVETRKAADLVLTAEMQSVLPPVPAVGPDLVHVKPQTHAPVTVVAATGRSITVKLSEAPSAAAPVRKAPVRLTPVRDAPVVAAAPAAVTPVAASSITVALPPAPVRPVQVAKIIRKPVSSRPRLERISLTEIALVTATAGTRFVPLKSTAAAQPALRKLAAVRPVQPLRLMNAARMQGLAANTRSFLAQRGWRTMAVGDAPTVRKTSVLLYPQGRLLAARRLAAQFRFTVVLKPSPGQMTLVLGRDAAQAQSKVKRV